MKFVFMHVPKCAGTTLHNLLVQLFPPERICPERYNGLHGIPVEELDRYDLFSAHTDYAGVERIPGTKHTLTVLRDPQARVVSLYRFWRSTDPVVARTQSLQGPLAAQSHSFEEFLQRTAPGIQGNIRNAMVRNFLGRCWSDEQGNLVVSDEHAVRVALANLAKFDTLGFTDQMDALVRDAYAAVGREPPSLVGRDNQSSPEQFVISDEARAMVEDATALDRAFFEGAKALATRRRLLRVRPSRTLNRVRGWFGRVGASPA